MTTLHATDSTDSGMAGIGRRARDVAVTLAAASSAAKNAGLRASAAAIRNDRHAILAANHEDVAAATSAGLSAAIIDRLALDDSRVEAMARSLEDIAELDDPIGTVMAEWERPNGLRISRVRVPLGVIGVIYESRPNVTSDAGGLCLKSGNPVILRGGSESFLSSRAIAACLARGLEQAGLPAGCIQLVPTRDRAAVGEMLAMDDVIDVIIPRGGRGLVERISAESRIPMFKHLEGLCHTYIHAGADGAMARDIVLNGKMRRTGICGATETLLVDRAAKDLLPAILGALFDAGCAVRGDAGIQAADPRVTAAVDSDWDTEYLDAILSARLVDGLDDAIDHIARHGSHHTETIVTDDDGAARKFFSAVDSGILLHNASTQFADGAEFGMGAEIGISTGKLHARGPVGVEQLTSYKYLVRGSGQVRP